MTRLGRSKFPSAIKEFLIKNGLTIIARIKKIKDNRIFKFMNLRVLRLKFIIYQFFKF